MKGSTDSYSLLDFFKKIVSILNLICKICSIIKNKKKIEIANLGQYNTRIQWILYTSQILENLSSNIHRQKHPHVTISHLQSLSRHALFKTLTHLSPIFSLPHFPASQTHPLLKHQTLTPHHPHSIPTLSLSLNIFSSPFPSKHNETHHHFKISCHKKEKKSRVQFLQILETWCACSTQGFQDQLANTVICPSIWLNPYNPTTDLFNSWSWTSPLFSHEQDSGSCLFS